METKCVYKVSKKSKKRAVTTTPKVVVTGLSIHQIVYLTSLIEDKFPNATVSQWGGVK